MTKCDPFNMNVSLTVTLTLLIHLISHFQHVRSDRVNEINAELERRCNKLCSTNGATYFDKDNSKCVCYLKRSIDDIDKGVMLKNAEGLNFEIVAPSNLSKRNAETTTETNLPSTVAAKFSPIDSILQGAGPLIAIKKEISAERMLEINRGLESTKDALIQLIGRVKVGKVDKKELQQEIDTLRKNLMRIMMEDNKMEAIEDIKDKHLLLKSRFLPKKKRRSIGAKSGASEMKDFDFEMNVMPSAGNDTVNTTKSHSHQHHQHQQQHSIIVQPPELIDE